jgi:hypothetical protein
MLVSLNLLDNVEGFVLLEQPVKETQTSQIVKRERYHEDWIAKLKVPFTILISDVSIICPKIHSSDFFGCYQHSESKKECFGNIGK